MLRVTVRGFIYKLELFLQITLEREKKSTASGFFLFSRPDSIVELDEESQLQRRPLANKELVKQRPPSERASEQIDIRGRQQMALFYPFIWRAAYSEVQWAKWRQAKNTQ